MTSIPAAICRISSNNFKRIISKAKDFFRIFYCISEITWNLEHFQKKDEYNGLIISEIIDTERRGYLKV